MTIRKTGQVATGRVTGVEHGEDLDETVAMIAPVTAANAPSRGATWTEQDEAGLQDESDDGQ